MRNPRHPQKLPQITVTVLFFFPELVPLCSVVLKGKPKGQPQSWGGGPLKDDKRKIDPYEYLKASLGGEVTPNELKQNTAEKAPRHRCPVWKTDGLGGLAEPGEPGPSSFQKPAKNLCSRKCFLIVSVMHIQLLASPADPRTSDVGFVCLSPPL